MMDPILRKFAEFVHRFDLAAPRIPYISSATGTWITEAEAMDPDYWARQLRQTVRFADGIGQALKTPDAILAGSRSRQYLERVVRAERGIH